jgi:hypothetical protein
MCRVAAIVLALFCPAFMSVCLGQGGRRTQAQQTLFKIHVVFSGIAAFHDSLGRLPDDAAAVCLANRWWCSGQSTERWLEDGWNRRLTYLAHGSEYEVRSDGPDGEMNTADDLVLDSGVERSRVRALAGCYTSASDSEADLPNQGFIALDTTRVRSAEYLVRAVAPGSSSAVWYPLPATFVFVGWHDVGSYRSMWLQADGDSLFGIVRRGTDVSFRDHEAPVGFRRSKCR